MLLRKLSERSFNHSNPNHLVVILSADRSLRERSQSKDLRLLLSARGWHAALGITLGAFLLCSGTGASFAQEDQRYVVLPQSEAKTIVRHKLLEESMEISGTWMPEQSDVDVLESQFTQVTELSRKNSAGRQVQHPETYFRQYVGVMEGSRKLIYVNAFCWIDNGNPPRDWRIQLIEIWDGGSCVWQALYDVSAKRFVAVSVNGYG
jgi:hypothetical protein